MQLRVNEFSFSERNYRLGLEDIGTEPEEKRVCKGCSKTSKGGGLHGCGSHWLKKVDYKSVMVTSFPDAW